MGPVAHPGEQLTVDEHRLEHGHVGLVTAAVGGIVHVDDVPLGEVVTEELDGLLESHLHRPQMHRLVVPLHDLLSRSVEDRVGEVRGDGDDRGPARSHQHVAHLADSRLEAPFKDRQGDRIDCVAAHAVFMVRL